MKTGRPSSSQIRYTCVVGVSECQIDTMALHSTSGKVLLSSSLHTLADENIRRVNAWLVMLHFLSEVIDGIWFALIRVFNLVYTRAGRMPGNGYRRQHPQGNICRSRFRIGGTTSTPDRFADRPSPGENGSIPFERSVMQEKSKISASR